MNCCHHHVHCCNHELKHCPHCDTIYCEKCGKEWKRSYATFTYTWPWQQTIGDTYYTDTKYSYQMNADGTTSCMCKKE